MPKKSQTGEEDSHVEGSKPGRRSLRKKKAMSARHDDVDGSIDGSVNLERRASQDSHTYAPSFGLRMRFAIILPTSGASFKYINDDGKVRNRKIVSEKQPEEWLDSFQTKALLPPPPAKMPHPDFKIVPH